MKKLLIITTALVAFGAGPAHADPVTGWLAGSVFAWAGGAAMALSQLVVGIGTSFIGTAIQKATMKSPEVSVKTEIDLGDDTPLSFVVGDYVTAGKRKYAGSWGRNTRFITEVIEVSCLPQGLAGLWVDDEAGEWATGEDAHAFVTAAGAPGDVRELTYAASATPGVGQIYVGRCLANNIDDHPVLAVRYYDGTQTTADPYLLWAFGADPDYPWTADHIGTGKSYVVVTAYYSSETQTSYPQFLWQLDPLPLYDPRKDSTNGGSGAHRWGNRATYEPSRNPAVIAYNLARGIYWGDEWIFGGRNLAAWRLSVAEWFAAMNAADATVTLAAGGTEPAYRAGAEITVDMDPAGVLEEIAKAANMRFAEVGGLLKPQIEVPSAAVLHITDDDVIITEGQSYSPFLAVGDTYNALAATYPDPKEKWASKDAREYVDADATAEDGQWVPNATGALVWVPRYLPTSVTYGAAPYRSQVQRLMRAQMRDYRRMRQHEFQLPPMAYALEPLVDKITWTSARNGYVAKEFLIEKVRKLPGMCVPIAIREVDAGDYDWSSDFELPTTDVTPVNPTLPLQPISGFTAVGVTILDTDGIARRPAIRCECASGENASAIRIQARRSGATDAEIDVTRPYDAPYRWFVLDVVGGVPYQVRGKLDARRAEWSAWVSATAPVVATETADVSAEVAAAIQTAQDQAAAAVAAANTATAIVADLQDQTATLLADVDAALADVPTPAEVDAAIGAAITTEATTRASADSSLSAQITSVSAIAARSRTYRQAAAPATGMVTGDLWFDTDDNNRAYRYSGTAWVHVDDARIDSNAAAITAESVARANADSSLAAQITTVSATASRARTYRQAAAPATGMATGDLWFDSDNGNRAYRWSGTAWVETDDARIADTAAAVSAEAAARADADGALASQIMTVSAAAARSRTYRQGTAPASGMVAGDLWFDTKNGNRAYRYSGSAWVATSDTRIDSLTASVTTQATAIADLTAGASAGYLIRVQAGGAVSLLDLVAADGSGDVPASVARIAATDILLDGSVAASQLTVTDLTGNLIGNGDFAAGDLRGWTATGYDGASVIVGADVSAPSEYVLRFAANNGQAGITLSRQTQHCVAGERFSLGYQYYAPTGASGQIYLQALWYDATGTMLSASSVRADITGNTGGWQAAAGVLVAPSGAVRMVLRLVRAAPSGSYTGAGIIRIALAYVRRQQSGAVLITPTSITGELVQARTLRGEHLEAGTITAASGVIGDLAVDTLQIAGNAVTIPTSAFAASELALPVTIGPYNVVQSVSYTSTGAPVLISFGFSFFGTGTTDSDSITIRVRRGATTLYSATCSLLADIPISGTLIDANAATGARTYTLEIAINTTVSSLSIRNRSLTAIEVKK
ncbi:hypothetical protein ACTTAI_16375 [Rhodobacter capsulatus]|uniref:hypothetical protein n=1 Tax=Rhodobacter capsulatus TaxID=1061 RepID=UPI00402548BB